MEFALLLGMALVLLMGQSLDPIPFSRVLLQGFISALSKNQTRVNRLGAH